MGVLNKLKGRMTGRNALTKGPGKEYEFEMDKDYSKDFSIGDKQSSYTSGSDAVSAGLAAAASQPEVKYDDRSQDLAEIGSKVGTLLGNKLSKRTEELDKLQEDNPDMTRGEARKKRRANKKEGE